VAMKCCNTGMGTQSNRLPACLSAVSTISPAKR
jgi:hypothetical protein